MERDIFLLVVTNDCGSSHELLRRSIRSAAVPYACIKKQSISTKSHIHYIKPFFCLQSNKDACVVLLPPPATEERARWISLCWIFLMYRGSVGIHYLLQSWLTFPTCSPVSLIFTHPAHSSKLIRKQLNGVSEGFISQPNDARLHQAIWRLKSNSHQTLI